MYSVCRNHNLVLSSCMTYHRLCNKSHTTDAACGTGTVYPSGTRSFLCRVLLIIICPFDLFSFGHCVVSRVLLRVADSDDSIGIFNLFFHRFPFNFNIFRRVSLKIQCMFFLLMVSPI